MDTRAGRRARAALQAGFTLMEMLAVMLILSILMAILVREVRSSQRAVDASATRTFLTELTSVIVEYREAFGKDPPSTFPSDLDPKPSRTNMGAEMLFISLFGRDSDWVAREMPENRLGNSDGDSTKTSLTTYSNADAFELTDVWDNPIAYIHRIDYGKEITYFTLDGETPLKGLVSPKTGDPYRKGSFQLISAGPDGVFLTGDDIANFEIERQ